jgi:hypothetical protein
MSKILFLEPSWFGTGLTNEFFFIIYGIINCINTNKNNLIINNFRLEPLTYKFTEISNILDIHYLNTLLAKYNITVFDKNKLKFNIENIKYGLDNNMIDITNEIINLFYSDNKLLIPRGTNLNNIKGDPVYGVKKKIYITYSINNIKTTEEYSEYLFQDIIINLQIPTHILDWKQIDDCYINNKDLFDYLLKYIKFNSRFVKYSEIALLIDKNNEYVNYTNLNLKNKKINVVHLRVERDITGHMLTHNKMTQEEYDDYLQNKYIKLIKQYFLKEDIIFILSYELNNKVIHFLKDNGYDFFYTKKNIFEGREEHAIVDSLIGEKCNNIYIGNWNFDIRQGSTFSYLLYIKNNAVQNIFIDMYEIKKHEILKDNININNISNKQVNTLTLKELVDNSSTDKNTYHSYLDLYEELLSQNRYKAKNILEIGIGDFKEKNGGSIKLWHDYFINANIYCIDILGPDRVIDEIKNNNRIKIFTETDGYDEKFFIDTFLNKNIKFDMVLDDGPHTLESMKQFIKLYSQVIDDNGILIIEDVQSIDWIIELKAVVPENLKKFVKSYDLRNSINIYDNIVFTINKNKFIEIENDIDNNIDGEK